MIAELTWPDWKRLTAAGAVAGSSDRPILASIYFETDEGRLRATATDSYRLVSVTADADIEEGSPALIHARQIKVATTAFDRIAAEHYGTSKWASRIDMTGSRIGLSAHLGGQIMVSFSVGEWFAGSFMLDTADDGRYPSYRPLLHKPTENGLALSTLRSRGKTFILDYLRVQYGFWAATEEWTVARLLEKVAEYRAKPINRRVGLNGDYLAGVLATTTQLDHRPLIIEMFGDTRPVFLSNPADPDWQAILMPVRL